MNKLGIVLALLVFIIFQCCTESHKTVDVTQQQTLDIITQPQPVEKIKLGDSLRLTLKISIGGAPKYSIRIRNDTIKCLEFDGWIYPIKMEQIMIPQETVDSLKKWITEIDDRHHLYLMHCEDCYLATLFIDRKIIFQYDYFGVYEDNRYIDYTEYTPLNNIINFMISYSPIEIILPDI